MEWGIFANHLLKIHMNREFKLTYEEQLNDLRWFTKRSIILNRDNYTCRMCGNHGNEGNPLSVHHRYYLYGALAWEYDNEVLITLCSNCHRLIHQTLSPLCYYNNGEKLIPMNFTPCDRCNGAGRFSEFEHIQGGICFKCNGLRYKELFQEKEKVIKDALEHFGMI